MASISAALNRILPAPQYEDESTSREDEQIGHEEQALTIINAAPPYGRRQGWQPRKNDDFGDGGAFPEIQVAQYPLDMGRKGKKSTSNALALQVDAKGSIKYDAIAKQGHGDTRIVHSSFKDLIPLRQRADVGDVSLSRPSEEEVQATAEKTRAALQKLVSGQLAAANPKNVRVQNNREPTYVRYTPANQMGESSSTHHTQRIIKMVDVMEDPMEPPKFKHRKIPRGPGSPPPPVMHSPPRRLTHEEQSAWSIPPSISNWKNNKGYTIPLDKRLAADGRGLQDVGINDNFAKLSEALFVADRSAREEVRERAKMQARLAEKEREAKEEHLRVLAQKAREERMGGTGIGMRGRGRVPERTRSPEEEMRRELSGSRSRERSSRRRPYTPSRSRSRSRTPPRRRAQSMADEESETEEDRRAAAERDSLRRERRASAERQLRLSRLGTATQARILHRDMSEKIALGLAKPSQSKEAMYDARLFNQESGVGSGFGEEDGYNIYSKGLFAAREGAEAIYRPGASSSIDVDGDDADEALARATKGDRFEVLGRAKKGFSGADAAVPREGPVVFEKDTVDPFGVDSFLREAKEKAEGGKKHGLDESTTGREEKRGRYE
ncbi:mRNA splicing protein [Saitoella coloradoensis]